MEAFLLSCGFTSPLDMQLLSFFFTLSVALFFLPIGTGQTTDATCLPFYAWMDNSHKQSPCQVASQLLNLCSPFTLLALPEDSQYSGPSLAAANPCICSTVVYSLMSACGACQGGLYQTWSTWSGNCPSISVGKFPEPIPPQTFVPGWAYFDVETSDTFNETAAKLSGNSTAESTALPTPSSTTLSRTSIISSTEGHTPTSSNPSTPLNSAIASDHRDDVILGSVLGATVGLAVFLGFVYWWYNRRRRLAITARSGVPLQSPSVESHISAPESADMQQYLANTVPARLGASSTSTSLASPNSAQLSNTSKPGSIRSNVPSNV